MDNHPIPQDVTHFQFRLVGQLTIKQFGYLVAGGILALIAFSLPMIGIVKTFFVFLFGGAGLLFAFIPIEGRPADLMLSYFFKALFEPNQYIYSKQGVILPYLEKSKSNNATTQNNIPDSTQFQQPLRTNGTLLDLQLSQTATSNFNRFQLPPQPNTPPPILPTGQQITTPIQQQAIETPQQQTPLTSPPTPAIQAPTPVTAQIPQQEAQAQEQTSQMKEVTLEKKLEETLSEKEHLQKQLEELQQQLKKRQAPQSTPSSPHQQQPVKQSTPLVVKNVATTTQSSLIAPDFPNIVMGVVKDARGNVLPNILIEVKDSNNNPVRAFKTNALGQFASATPLLNGTYTILFEDPTKIHSFDAVEIVANGEIMQPIEIISLDKREELRKELFG